MERKAPQNYHPENISGKGVIVTGGTTGIGRAVAKTLASRGARVFIYGRDEQDLQEALDDIGAGGEVHGIAADQSRPEDIERVFHEAQSKLGTIDILVNNAAVSAGSVTEASAEDIRYAINVNIGGYLTCCALALQRMQSRGRGHIVNIGSMSADLREEENDVYVATKAAIQAFSESLREVVNPKGIKVTLIEPGLVGTDMASASPEEQAQKRAEGEMLQAQDIAEAVHYALTQPDRCAVVALQIRPIKQAI